MDTNALPASNLLIMSQSSHVQPQLGPSACPKHSAHQFQILDPACDSLEVPRACIQHASVVHIGDARPLQLPLYARLLIYIQYDNLQVLTPNDD